MDLYGISSAALHENEFAQQAERAHEINEDNNKKNKIAYSQAKSALQSSDNNSVEKIVVGQLGDYTRGAHVATGVGALGRAAGRVGRAAFRDSAAAGVATESVPEAIRGIKAGTAVGGFGPAAAPLFPKLAGKGVTAGKVGGAALKGGRGISDLEGAEGILQKGLKVGGGGGEFALVGAKGIANLGAVVDGIGLAENWAERGNPLKNADGKKMSGADIAADALTIGGGVLDVASVFTGGALVPLAAAVNLAAAGVSAEAGVKDIEAKDALLGDKPKQTAGAPLSQYASLGFVGSMSHDPVRAIRGSGSF